jgi:cell fate regulator YaaT (PSP1 superfamily)
MLDSSIEDLTATKLNLEPQGLYLVKFGFQGEIIPVRCPLVALSRGDEVVCRTRRGIEMGEVLASTNDNYVNCHAPAKYIRRSRPDDQLLWRQLRSLSAAASLSCQSFLQEHGSPDTLIEVEPLIDGRTLFFHFLGEPSPETEAHVQELANVYQQKVAASRFAQLLEHGCGPGCGTKESSECGASGGCAVCAIAGKCTSK